MAEHNLLKTNQNLVVMLKFKMFEVRFDHLMERYYLMVAGAIILGFLHQFVLAAFWAMVIAPTCILGVSIQWKEKKVVEREKHKVIPVHTPKTIPEAA